jgi:hypothetical protein
MRKWSVWLVLVCALAITPRDLFAAEGSSDAQLVAVVRQALAAAPNNFAGLRAGVLATSGSEIDYKPSPSFAKLCPACATPGVVDLFATAANDERWAARFRWNVDPSITKSRLPAYVRATFAPLVPGSSFSQGIDKDDGSLWFDWGTGKKQFLYVATSVDAKGRSSLLVGIGHYLSQNVHVVRFSRGLTSADHDALVNAIRNYVTIAVANADSDFLSLRGAASTDKLKSETDDFFSANVTFGDLLETCDIDSILYPASDTGDTSHWVFSCTTKTIGGPKSDVASVVHDAVVAALPSGFSQTTDPRFLNSLDYRWDRSSDRAMISIGSSDDDDGTTFYLNVHHYIPNR